MRPSSYLSLDETRTVRLAESSAIWLAPWEEGDESGRYYVFDQGGKHEATMKQTIIVTSETASRCFTTSLCTAQIWSNILYFPYIVLSTLTSAIYLFLQCIVKTTHATEHLPSCDCPHTVSRIMQSRCPPSLTLPTPNVEHGMRIKLL